MKDRRLIWRYCFEMATLVDKRRDEQFLDAVKRIIFSAKSDCLSIINEEV
jgi:hypothetical protein